MTMDDYAAAAMLLENIKRLEAMEKALKAASNTDYLAIHDDRGVVTTIELNASMQDLRNDIIGLISKEIIKLNKEFNAL